MASRVKAQDGPPHQPCWQCVMPQVCPFPHTCAVFKIGVAGTRADPTKLQKEQNRG